ncbi:MAG: DUF3164 family protein [Rhodospirillaceae bacterium]|nr:DUF3164 family protein [Rhodospirillaceae bacterium]
MTTTPETPAIPAGYMLDAKGRLVPETMVKPQERLEDQTVRKIIGFADALSAQIGRFKGHTFEDVATFMDLLADQYGAAKGGAKGNVTLTTYDGCMKVVVQVQDSITFGPELQVAKTLFDACISKWTEGSNDNIHVLVDHAFQVDKEGRINRSALFGLRRLDIADAEWQRAVAALNDSIRVIGSREYVRFYRRPNGRASWQAISVDLASAVAPANEGEAA